MMRTEDLDFQLPSVLVAQSPSGNRDGSRLLHYRRNNREMIHRSFHDLPAVLRKSDVLVFNDAKVLPARFMLRKATGGKVEGLFLSELDRGKWCVLLRNLGPARELSFDNELSLPCSITRVKEAGECEILIGSDEPAIAILSRLGRMPLPPYIRREKGHDQRDAEDRDRYQTVYASSEGSVAAPTAGLHFTESLMAELDACGVERATVTLDVGMGTFKPITADALDHHQMHVETYSISEKTAEALNRAKREKRRIVAVGTTSARVLESQPDDVPFQAKRGETGILIQPPYLWKHVDALITNFHLPRSTLIALVAALVGLQEQRRIYRTAIEQRYRFFSYGDAMFIE